MKAFCPNCGTQNEGMAGGRATCKACTASFEIPREEGGSVAPAKVSAPPPPVVLPQASQYPTGYVGPPPSGFSLGNNSSSGPLNTLAVVSLVLGVLCCLPFASIGAIVTGAVAQNQIAASHGLQRGREFAIIGMVLGGFGLLVSIGSLVMSLLGKL